VFKLAFFYATYKLNTFYSLLYISPQMSKHIHDTCQSDITVLQEYFITIIMYIIVHTQLL